MKLASAALLLLSVIGSASSFAWEHRAQGTDRRHLEEMDSFQLKMYWEEGYFWQEEDFERRWCLTCEGGACGEGDRLEIRECDKGSNKQRFVFENVVGSGGGRLKPFLNQDLCWTSVGGRRHELRPCDMSCKQIIVGLEYAGRFEMHPNGKLDECLEQHHHPRKGEVVRANDCEESRDDTTSYWVMIHKEGPSVKEKEEEVLRGSTTIRNLGKEICTNDNRCGLCMGNCESDADCRDGLVCMHRTFSEYVPGCVDTDRDGNMGLNVCYNLHGTYTLPPTQGPMPTSPAAPLTGECGSALTSTTPIPPSGTNSTLTPTPSNSTLVNVTTPAPSTSTPVNATTSPPFVDTNSTALPTTTVAPPPTSITTLVPASTTTTVAPSTSTTTLVPTSNTNKCELDDKGAFGNETSRVLSVSYFYELVTDPTTQNRTTEDIISVVGMRVLEFLLPTLFGDICTASPSMRKLANVSHAPAGVRKGWEGSVNGVPCTSGDYSASQNCTVVVSSIIVFTDGDEVAYDEVLLPIIKDALDGDELNDDDLSIVDVLFLDQAAGSGATSTSSSESQDFGNIGIIIICVGVAAFAVGIVALATVVIVWRRKKTQAVDAEDMQRNKVEV